MRALADDHVGDDGVERLLEDRLIEPVHVGPMRDKRASSQVGTDLRKQDLLPVVQDLLGELVERALQGVGAFRGAAMPEMVFFVIALASNQIGRSEEHTSELQSLMRISYAVFCLKKKNNKTI